MTFQEDELGRLLTAVKFSAVKHRKQRRKGIEEHAYVTHPIQVAEIMWNVGGVRDLDVIIAGLLHDTIEDTDTTADEISEKFGASVADMVLEVSDDKSLEKSVRKQLQIEHAAHASHGAKQIKLADKITNIYDIQNNPPAKWDVARKSTYITWACDVVAGLRGANPALEALFDRVVRDAREHLSKDAGSSHSLETDTVGA